MDIKSLTAIMCFTRQKCRNIILCVLSNLKTPTDHRGLVSITINLEKISRFCRQIYILLQGLLIKIYFLLGFNSLLQLFRTSGPILPISYLKYDKSDINITKCQFWTSSTISINFYKTSLIRCASLPHLMVYAFKILHRNIC